VTERTRYAALARLIRGMSDFDDPDDPLPCADFVDGDSAVEFTLARIAPLLTKWPEAPKFLRDALQMGPPIEQLSQPRPGLEPSGGKIDELPLYCALWMQPVASTEAAARVVQASVLVAAAILFDEEEGIGAFASSTKLACRAVRQIGTNVHAHPDFMQALAQPQSASGVLEAILTTWNTCWEREVAMTKGQANAILKIRVLLRDALESRRRRDGITRARHSQAPVVSLVADADAPAADDSSRTNHSEDRQTRLRAERRVAEVDDLAAAHSILEDETDGLPGPEEVAEGAAPTSESPRRSVAVVDVPLTVPANFVGQAAMLWRAKNAARAIASSHQSLLAASDRLQLVDLEAAERYVGEHLQGADGSTDLRQGAIVTAAMLVTSLSIDDIRNIRVVDSIHEVPDRPKMHYLVLEGKVLVVPCPHLGEGYEPRGADCDHYRPAVERIDVELPRQLKWVGLLMQFVSKKAWATLFSKANHVESAGEFIRRVNKSYASRLTLARISQFQARQLAVTTGDRADAALLTGGTAGARPYYYAPSLAHLGWCYESMWKGAYKGMGLPPEKASWAKRAYTKSWDEPSEPFTGSRACPTEEGVALMVEAMVKHCRSVLRGRRSKLRMRRVHNALVGYTCQMILWHTGIRAVNDPVEIGLYDPVTNLLGVSDKNNDSYYSSRVVWIPPIAQRQINAYQKHSLEYQRQFPHLAEQGNKLFFVDEDNRAVPVRVELLKQQLPEGHVYPLNAQRHYLRTRLRELDVPAQSIDALLGHGALGEEPYARHSCYSAARLREDIEAAIFHLSEKAGWVVLQGLS
jgi:hypothetical protein